MSEMPWWPPFRYRVVQLKQKQKPPLLLQPLLLQQLQRQHRLPMQKPAQNLRRNRQQSRQQKPRNKGGHSAQPAMRIDNAWRAFSL